jgi:hypothetical protein
MFTVASGRAVYVNSDNKLVSSCRFKDEIRPMDRASEAILALKPVTFHYKRRLNPIAPSCLDSSPRKWNRWIPIW